MELDSRMSYRGDILFMDLLGILLAYINNIERFDIHFWSVRLSRGSWKIKNHTFFINWCLHQFFKLLSFDKCVYYTLNNCFRSVMFVEKYRPKMFNRLVLKKIWSIITQNNNFNHSSCSHRSITSKSYLNCSFSCFFSSKFKINIKLEITVNNIG